MPRSVHLSQGHGSREHFNFVRTHSLHETRFVCFGLPACEASSCGGDEVSRSSDGPFCALTALPRRIVFEPACL